MMKLFPLIFLIALTGCSTNSIPHRLPSSLDLNSACLVDDESHYSKQEQSLCQWTQEYLRQLSNSSFNLQMSSQSQSLNNRKVITLTTNASKKDIENIIGRGGLRIRYLRYMINELSYQNTLNATSDSNKEKAIQTFPLVELILEQTE